MDDAPPYGLTPAQWSSLADEERLMLMTADAPAEQVVGWVRDGAAAILERVTKTV